VQRASRLPQLLVTAPSMDHVMVKQHFTEKQNKDLFSRRVFWRITADSPAHVGGVACGWPTSL
jgi:hypothetical protein